MGKQITEEMNAVIKEWAKNYPVVEKAYFIRNGSIEGEGVFEVRLARPYYFRGIKYCGQSPFEIIEVEDRWGNDWPDRQEFYAPANCDLNTLTRVFASQCNFDMIREIERNRKSNVPDNRGV